MTKLIIPKEDEMHRCRDLSGYSSRRCTKKGPGLGSHTPLDASAYPFTLAE